MKDIQQRLLDDRIQLVLHSHNSSYRDPIAYYKKEINRRLTSTIEYWGKLNYNLDVDVGEYITFVECHCNDCGRSLFLFLLDDMNLHLYEQGEYFDHPVNEKNERSVDFSTMSDCPAKELVQAKKLTSVINVTSGKLAFLNCIRSFKEKDEGKYDERSVSTITGRNNLMQYLAENNIGYGQMGNMSVSIHLKNDGTEIIVGDDYYIDENEEESNRVYEGFTNVGEISLDVWRWMCADVEILNKKERKEAVICNVMPGKWKIDHFYDFSEEEDVIYSKLSLIN